MVRSVQHKPDALNFVKSQTGSDADVVLDVRKGQ
jgi:hypothetical protein